MNLPANESAWECIQRSINILRDRVDEYVLTNSVQLECIGLLDDIQFAAKDLDDESKRLANLLSDPVTD